VLKKVVAFLAQQPTILNILRRFCEFNYIDTKRAIRKELLINNSPGRKFLDLGCGTGEFSRLFDPASYIGIDISENYINYAKENYKREFYCRDARRTNFNNSSFDDILIVGVFHHLDDYSVLDVLKEARRLLKKNGRILIIEATPANSQWNIVGRILKRYDMGENIKAHYEYWKMFEKDFIIEKYYSMKAGFFNHSVFVLKTK